MDTEIQVLRLESPKRIYGVEKHPTLHSEVLDELTISEEFELSKQKDSHQQLGNYVVTITTEYKKNSFDDLDKKKKAAKNIAGLLDKIWIYATAYPLRETNFSRLKLFEISPIPYLWTSNLKEAKITLSGSKSWMIFPELPLKSVCKALKKYETLDDLTVYLIDLHHTFLINNQEDPPLFLLGKALEIVETLTEGNTRSQKSTFLNEQIGTNTTISLDELLRISNTRREIRHAVLKKDINPELHSKLNSEEIYEFSKNANIFIRYTVCCKLNIPFPIPQNM